MSRLSIAYIFWALGGIFGLHHIYLGRLTHAIFFNLTFAFCGLGWIYDFFHIPQYVKQANGDSIYLGLLKKKIKERPPWSIPRALALYVAAYFFSHFSLATIGLFEPIEARIGANLVHLPTIWIIASTVIQIIGIWIGCLLISSIGGQRTVSRSYLVLPIIIGSIMDIFLAHVAGSRQLIICRALFPTLFYLRSCEWLPTCANPRPRYFTSFTRFLKLYVQYCFFTFICLILILGSLYFYCDVFVAQDGSIEYSDTNYGLGFDQNEWLISKFSWDTPSFKPIIDNTTSITIDTTSGKQPQYNYPQFQYELYNFYHNSLNSTSSTASIPSSTSTPTSKSATIPTDSNQSKLVESTLHQLSLPYSYRVRDLCRNIYFSSILKPVHSAINYYNVDYTPGFDPLFPPLTNNTTTIHQQPISLLSIITEFDSIIIQLFSKISFTFRCGYYFIFNSIEFIQLHGVSKYIIELDVQGLSWAYSYLTYLNHGKPIYNIDTTTIMTRPIERDLPAIKTLVTTFIIQRLTPVQGDVSKLSYWSQRAIYDAIVAYGRLNPQKL